MIGTKPRQKKQYSIQKEIEYYAASASDRKTVGYEHLDCYFLGSVGTRFFDGKKVLDMGCGEGVYSAWIADRGKAESVVGIELTSHRIRTDYAKELTNLKFLCADLFSPPIRERQFDTVFMNLVLHHVRFGLSSVIDSIKACLRSGGTFLAFEPNVYSPLAVAAHLYYDRSANEGFLSPVAIRNELRRAGFQQVDYGFFWRDRKWAKNPLLASSFWIRADLV